LNLFSNHPDHRLSAEDLHLIFDANYETGFLTWKPRHRDFFKSNRSASIWKAKFEGQIALNANHPDGYKTGLVFGKAYLTHRILLAMKLGYWPQFVDHINGNKADNRLCNLREVTKSENGCNLAIPKNNKSGCMGVSWNERDKRWSAYITLNQKRKALGNFTNKQDAIDCRKLAELRYGFHHNHGRTSCLVNV